MFSLSLSVLAGLSVWQYHQAEQQRIRAEQQKQIAAALANIPKTSKITADILQYNVQALDKIYTLNPNYKTEQREQYVNYTNVGDLYLNLLGDTDKFLKFQQQALAISQKIAQQDPTNSAAQRDLLASYGKLGLFYKQLKQNKPALDFW